MFDTLLEKLQYSERKAIMDSPGYMDGHWLWLGDTANDSWDITTSLLAIDIAKMIY